jgi:hypothetical protein
MNTSQYLVSIEFTPNEQYNPGLPEEFYIKTPLGNMLNPELSQKTIILLHDMASIMDEIRRISENDKHLMSTQTFDTDYSCLVLKIKKVKTDFNLLHLCVLALLTASTVFVLTYYVFK